jgi:hypothetical protein
VDPQLAIVDTTAPNQLARKVREALSQAITGHGKLRPEILEMDGMSGEKYRLFINNLIGTISDARYLEVGVWQGSTLLSAIDQNKVGALAVDNWTEFDGPAETFFTNLGRFKGQATVSFLESDFRAVNFSAIGKFNVYFFDGPHQEIDHYDGVTLAQPALDDQFVLIVDDWNWEHVRQGTLNAIEASGLQLDYAAEIRTTFDNSHAAVEGPASDWHNGYFIAACSKRAVA